MTREIKFRAWDEDKKEIIFLDQIVLCAVPMIGLRQGKKSDTQVTSQFPFMQYTGLKDTSGVDIYEDDIMQDEEGDIFQVYFNQDQAQFKCDLIGEGGQRIFDEFSIQDCHGIVIGNIYENPELLKS